MDLGALLETTPRTLEEEVAREVAVALLLQRRQREILRQTETIAAVTAAVLEVLGGAAPGKPRAPRETEE